MKFRGLLKRRNGATDDADNPAAVHPVRPLEGRAEAASPVGVDLPVRSRYWPLVHQVLLRIAMSSTRYYTDFAFHRASG